MLGLLSMASTPAEALPATGSEPLIMSGMVRLLLALKEQQVCVGADRTEQGQQVSWQLQQCDADASEQREAGDA